MCTGGEFERSGRITCEILGVPRLIHIDECTVDQDLNVRSTIRTCMPRVEAKGVPTTRPAPHRLTYGRPSRQECNLHALGRECSKQTDICISRDSRATGKCPRSAGWIRL